MSNDIADMLYRGALALQQGRREEARELLMHVLERDQNNEQAWLWLSGAVDDLADQQVALENVLALNPSNQTARDGLAWIESQLPKAAPPAPIRVPSTKEWTPPPPLGPDDVMELGCYKCGSSLYSVAQFCWQCHAPVHCCNNCVFKPVTRCKELQNLTSTMSQGVQNQCPWWRPH